MQNESLKLSNLTLLLIGVLFIVMGFAVYVTNLNPVGAIIMVAIGISSIIIVPKVSQKKSTDSYRSPLPKL